MQEEHKLILKPEPNKFTNRFQSMSINSYSYQSVQIHDQIIDRPLIVQKKRKSQNNHQHSQQCSHASHDNQNQDEDNVQQHHQVNSNINDHGRDNHEGHNHEGHNHREHNHARKKGNNHNRESKSVGIIIYTVFTILCVAYLSIYYFNTIQTGFYRTFFDCSIYFTITMSLWSYYQTVRINNKPFNLKNLKVFQKKQYYDPIYEMTAKLCFTCDNYKYPRVSHCSNCGQCIYKLDHHCMWSQNCIGYKNQRTFYLFSFYMFTGVLQYLYGSYNYFWIPTFWHENSFTFYILWLITNMSVIIVGIMIVMLVIVHTNLILTNTTTLDLIKSKNCFPIPFFEIREKNLNEINYFDRGQIANIVGLFGSSLLTFWMPFERKIKNEILPQKMNPEPTKLQINRWNESIAKQEFERQQKMKSFLSNVKLLYKGKKMLIGNETIILN